MKLAVVILMICTTVGCAGKSKHKKPEADKQCRFVWMFAGHPETITASDWEDCIQAEAVADGLYEQAPVPDVVIWTDERSQTKKGWTAPIQHTDPRKTPSDFTTDWNEI